MSKTFAALAKSYTKSGNNVMSFAVKAVEYARDNGHSVVYCQRLLDLMEGNDIADMTLILRTLAPCFVIKEGHISITKKKERVYDLDKAKGFEGSFRTFANSLRVKEDAPEKVFDMDKLAERVAKQLEKNNAAPDAFAKALNAALIKQQQAKKAEKAKA